MTQLRPPILATYLLKEILPLTLLAFLILTTLVFAQQTIRYSDLLLTSLAPLPVGIQLLLCLLPGVVVITLPISLLLGTILSLNRLSADSETIATQAGTVSSLRLTAPIILLGVIGTLTSAALTNLSIPQAVRQVRLLKTQILLQAAGTQLKPQTFNTDFPGHLIYISNIDRSTNEWVGVFILKKAADAATHLLTARRGQLRLTETHPATLEVSLLDGLSLESSTDSFTPSGDQKITSFERLTIKLSVLDIAASETKADSPETIQEAPLSALAQKVRQAGNNRERLQSAVEWHRRLSLPVACLALLSLAIPLGARTSRHSGRTVGFAIGFSIAVFYYLLLIFGQNLALSGAIPTWLGVWLANLACPALALTLRGPRSSSLYHRPLRPHTATGKHLSEEAFRPWGQRLKGFILPSPGSLINLINLLLVSELAKYFLLAAGVLVITSVIFTLFDLIPSIARSGVGLQYAAAYLCYLAPQIVYYVTPFALLLTILTSYNLLSRTNQITALYAGGQGSLRLAIPIFAAVWLVISALFFLSEGLLPKANREQDYRYHRIKGRQIEQAAFAFGQKWVYGLNDSIYSYQYSDRDNRLLNTTVYRLAPNTHLLREMVYLGEAKPTTNSKVWRASSGWSYRLKDQLRGDFRLLTEEGALIDIPDGPEIFRYTVNEATKMNHLELQTYISHLRRIGVPTTEMRMDLEKKKAFPFSCLTLTILALPFALANNRKGTLAGVGLSIVISLTFWSTTSLFEMAGKKELLPIWLGAWGAQALFSALGTYLFFRRRV